MAKRLMKGGNAAIALIPFIVIFVVILMIVLWQSGVFGGGSKSSSPPAQPVPVSPTGLVKH